MWTSAVVALVVSQAVAVKVAAPSFTLVGIAPELGNVFQDRFVSRLGSPDLRVTTSRDIEQLLGSSGSGSSSAAMRLRVSASLSSPARSASTC